MKIQQNTPENESIGEFKEIQSSIATENLGLALGMVSKNLYSDPISSFIREITSNAVDAHVDANEDAPVLIEIYREDDLYFIDFKDNGCGMTPEVFKTIYMSWFNSDKRKTNSKIGGWGLGSKSPLAYQDSFEIITRVDGTKWHYILANADPVPTSTLLLTEPTTQGNGTTIRIEINEDDLWKVSSACKKQLAYFDNVYVKNTIHYYDNNFKIYESDTFKLRNGDFPFGKKMHICLGQVAYPINFNSLDIDEVYIPVALKFNIGDLDVTLSREDINYTESVKQKIKKRIEVVKEIIYSQYDDQLKIDDFMDYIKLVKSNNLPPFKIKDIEINLHIERDISFTPFKEVHIKKDDISTLFSIFSVSRVNRGKATDLKQYYNQEYYRLYRHPQTCYLVENSINYFDVKYISEGYLFKKRKFNKSRFRIYAEALNLYYYKDIYNENGHIVESKRFLKPGAAKLIHKVSNFVYDYIKQHISNLKGQAPESWIQEQKELQRIKKEETKGEITYYNIYNNREKIKLAKLIEDYQFIFYIDKNIYKETIFAYDELYNLTYPKFKTKAIFLIVSPTVIKKIKKFKNVYPADYLLKVKSIRHTLQRLVLRKEVEKLWDNRHRVFKYSKKYTKKLQSISYLNTGIYSFTKSLPIDALNKKTFTIDLTEYFKDEIDLFPKKYFLHQEYIEEIKDFLKNTTILRYIDDYIPHEELRKLVKLYKIKNLDYNFYNQHSKF